MGKKSRRQRPSAQRSSPANDAADIVHIGGQSFARITHEEMMAKVGGDPDRRREARQYIAWYAKQNPSYKYESSQTIFANANRAMREFGAYQREQSEDADVNASVNGRDAMSRERDHDRRRHPLKSWKRLIRLQIKMNRDDRMRTALNRVEARKREIIRMRCNATKHATNVVAFSQPGPSGPRRSVAWIAQEATGPSKDAKREAKKKIAQVAIRENAERKQMQIDRQAAVELEMMRNLQIADEMMRGA